MAKVLDLVIVKQEIADMIDEKCPDLVDLIGREPAIFCVLAIYQTNDICNGYGQDFVSDASRMMISGHEKVSVI